MSAEKAAIDTKEMEQSSAGAWGHIKAGLSRVGFTPFGLLVFIIIACGALSGFHALIASGTTPKLIEKESQVRMVGYGAMLLEGALAVIVMDIRENDKPPGKKPAGSSLPAADDSSDEARLRRVRQEIRALDTRDDKVVLGEMGDMVFRLTEVDGGLAVDGTIALPDGRGPGAHSPIFLGMMVQIGALSTLTLAPGLSQEITGAIIRQAGDRLEVSAVLSTASLLEGARGLVAQKTRLQELRQEEQELARRIRERKNDE